MGPRTTSGRPGRSRRHARGDLRDQTAAGARRLHALVNNAAISPKAEGGKRLSRSDHRRRLGPRVSRQLFRPDHAGTRPDGGAQSRQGLSGQRHVDRGLARAPVRRHGCSTSKAALASLTREMAADFGSSASRLVAPVRSTPRSSPRHREIVAHQIAASPGHARRGRQDHLRAVHGDLVLRERRRDPHQRRAARLTGRNRRQAAFLTPTPVTTISSTKRKYGSAATSINRMAIG